MIIPPSNPSNVFPAIVTVRHAMALKITSALNARQAKLEINLVIVYVLMVLYQVSKAHAYARLRSLLISMANAIIQ